MTRSAVRARTVAAAAAALAVVAAVPVAGPRLLRHVPWFDVRRVEISGTHLLAPHQVLAASGIRAGQSVWSDLDRWESALRADPAIANARVSRRLPSTLRIRVTEKRPLAYVEDGALDPVTATGEILPLDPTRSPVDLPVIRGSWSRTPPATRHALLRETDRLSRLDPALLAQVAEIRPSDPRVDCLVLRHRLAEIVLPVGVGSDRLAELGEVLADLERRGVAVPSGPPPRIDLRYEDQIVVRLPSSV
jgi:cell division protein FtsQ